MTLPNQLTVLRMVLTPVAVFLLLMQDIMAKQIGTGVFIVASLTDWYDGHCARKYGYVTDWGKFLDPLADKILISSMLLCFVLLNYIRAVWVIMIVMRDVVITALRGYMMMYEKPIAARRIAKWKTFSQVGLVYTILLYINLAQSHAVNPEKYTFLDSVSFSVIIDRYAQIVAYFTVLTGIVYLADNRKPLLELFGRFYRFVIPFNLYSETNTTVHDSESKAVPEEPPRLEKNSRAKK